MDIYRKSASLAKRFDAQYPDGLPDRLVWWRETLGIDRKRFLRMLGFDAHQAAKKANYELEDILKNPTWEARASVVEGTLHRLLSLYGYDWKALAASLRSAAVQGASLEASRVARGKGENRRLPHVPSARGSEMLLNQIASGGPEALLTMYAYLARTGVPSASNGG